MDDLHPSPLPFTASPSLRSRAPQALVFVFLAAALLLYVYLPFLAARGFNLPAGPEVPRAAFYLPYLAGLVYLAAAVWAFALRRKHAQGRAFTVFCASVALSAGLAFDGLTTRALVPLWSLALVTAGGAAVEMALRAAHERLVQRPLLPFAALAAGWLLALFSLLAAGTANGVPQAVFAFTAACFVLALALAVYALARQQRNAPQDRSLLWLTLAGLISFCPACLGLIEASLGASLRFSPYLLTSLPVFPLVAGYAAQRHRMYRADAALSRGLQYVLLSVMVAAGYSLITAGLATAFGELLPFEQSLLTGLVFFVIAMLINPAREAMQRLVDAVFFRGKRAYQDRLQTFSGELTHVVDLPGIVQILRRYIDETLSPGCLHIFVHDARSDQFTAAPGPDGHPTSDMRFSTTSPLAAHLSDGRGPLVLHQHDALPPALEADRSRLALLGAQVFAPLPGRGKLAGWLALGPRLSGEPYSSIQMAFIESLCDQAALALERAQVIARMESRVDEMNVLTRVAQGINITLSLDDILELVYAQTVQIIPARHFRIMLHRADLNTYEYVFYLENDERDTGVENRPIPPGQAIEQEVIRQRRSILAADYHSECQRLGIIESRRQIFAWMGVPLNAGAETIGALSLGSGDPAAEYTAEQLSLLQAIADQVAGALVKARLLQETDRRARQLTTLNEVTRQLTSTLETEPLLNSILNSAVEMLNCEAGSLLLVDPQTGELVFRVTTGPVAGDLVGRRLPPGRGVVGKAVQTASAIIVNDVAKHPEWFSQTDQQTGFVTRSLLVIPLMVKDRVTGVIEVINKRDGSIFLADDQNLLTAFASQAAVAIENARLYTLTDQALADRVEELSIMQRIDRELNAGLDVSNAIHITLEWAMRRSGAAAGLVAMLKEDDSAHVHVTASQGYTHELEPYPDGLLPVDGFSLEESIKNGLPLQRAVDPLNQAADMAKPVLDGARGQAIIPIRREMNTIGLLLLESTSEISLSEETMSFLERLCDHASIAISNAQLYAAVQSANLAKSDFISFVAHELKNPMTSVKGYTELIAAGAVGPVNEVQANFLSTIRHNIERMNTLVSDLNDSSKIEVGRLRLNFTSLRLSEVIDSTIRSTRKQIEEKQQTLTLNIPDDLPDVWADKTRLEQVIVNLVSNAHKYTPAGGLIEITAERSPNHWDLSGPAEVVHIWVKDNGIGISEEDQQKIFQKFFRSDDPKTREVPGTGLGLNITKSLVEMQGGCIWFESEFRQGTTFHFTIPVSEN